MSRLASLLPQSLKPWLWRKLSDYMHLDYRLPSGLRVKISSYSDWCIYNDIFITGEYDPAIARALDRSHAAETFRIVDLGANVGFFTLRVLDFISRHAISFSAVHCLLVEGSPRLERSIHEHIDGLADQRIRTQIVIGLVGRKAGEAHLELGSSECMNRVVDSDTSQSRSMPYYDLDAALAHVSSVDLLKCDIEGSEREFLSGYPDLLQKTGVAIFEFHEPQCPATEGISKVMKEGFRSNHLLLDQGRSKTVFFER